MRVGGTTAKGASSGESHSAARSGLTGSDLIEIGRMIDKAIEVRMAPAHALNVIDAEESRSYGGHNAVQTAPAHPMRPGVIAELQEFRSLVFARLEDLDQQIQSIRNRLNALESHVFGDGPQAVGGR